MTFPYRRKPLALIFCCGFASVFFGAYAIDALAQAPTSLRVDPVLLGLPPAGPAEAPAPAEKSPVEIKPVEAAIVETRPVEAEAEIVKPAKARVTPVQETPARPPAVVVPVPAPAPAQAQAPVPAPAPAPATLAPPDAPARSAIRPADPAPPPQAPAAKRVAPQALPVAPVPPASSRTASTIPASASLRVDPALLGVSPGAISEPLSEPSRPAVDRGPVRPVAARTTAVSPLISSAKTPADERSWYLRMWDPLSNAYDNGAWEFYLPLVTHHLRSQYTAEKIAGFQERPLGFGVGRGVYDEKGNWDGVYGMAFQDSHSKPMYMLGYGWKSIWRPAEDVRLGLGYAAGLMSRTDIFHYVPFPAVLPMASLAYKNFNLEGIFLPGGKGNGNIFFIWAKWELGKNGEAIGTPARPPAPAPTLTASSGSAPRLVDQRVPYGPAFDVAGSSGGTAAMPPLAASGAARDDEEMPDALPPLALRWSKSMEAQAKESDLPRPAFLSAQRMGGLVDREFVAEGDSELRKIGTVVKADRLTYWPIDDEVEAEGKVELEQGDDLVTGPKMRLKLEDQVGYFEQPSYFIKRQPQSGSKAASDKAYAANYSVQQNVDFWNSGFSPALAPEPANKVALVTEARGEADRLNFEGENQFRLINGTYTTCSPGNDDWYAKSSNLKLDYDREVASGEDGTVYFKDVPIFYSPWLSFSLNNARKSGFLLPSFRTSTNSGVELSLPYYWNIAPNMDATITPRVMSKRGLLVGNEFRYLNTAYGGLYQGQARADILPGDRLRDGDNRYAVSLQHQQALANGFSGAINYNKVSDDNYYTDLSTAVSSTSTTQLLQQGTLSYGGGGWWTATANFQQYQTLQPDPANPVREPYRLLPQFTVNARKPDLFLTDSSFMGQYSNFTRVEQTINGVKQANDDGQRTVLYPQVALPYVTPGWYVTPKVGLNVRHYSLSGQAAGTPNSINSTLPIFSVDSGMSFERPSNWFGRNYTQTLEPRLYYLNIPYKNQDLIPIFDSGLADFNFAQIFSENQFSSWDRINNANQLTAAVTSRLIEPDSGNEIMRAMFGQRYYFTRNRVALTASTSADDGKWDRSDILAAFSGQVLPKVFADAAWQYNVDDRQLKRYSMGARYQPEPGKVLNAAYRYNRDANAPIDQVDFSGQWPISGRWHAVGRLNYSFKDDATNIGSVEQGGRVIESIAGFEYNGGCWVVRGVVQRTALTQASKSTAFFLQLELNDFARVGSNPLDLLKRNIQGYSLINKPAAAAFGE